FFRNCVDARGGDPAVVELEQCADRDRVENCLVIPAGGSQLVDIGDGWQVFGYSGGKSQQGLLLLVQRRTFQITQDAPDKIVAQEFRGNGSVGLHAEFTLVEL